MPIFRTPAEDGGHDRLVVRGPHRHAVAQAVEDHTGILGKPVGAFADGPAAAILQGLGQVPVVQRHVGGDPGSAQFIHQPVVKIETALVHFA